MRPTMGQECSQTRWIQTNKISDTSWNNGSRQTVTNILETLLQIIITKRACKLLNPNTLSPYYPNFESFFIKN